MIAEPSGLTPLALPAVRPFTRGKAGDATGAPLTWPVRAAFSGRLAVPQSAYQALAARMAKRRARAEPTPLARSPLVRYTAPDHDGHCVPGFPVTLAGKGMNSRFFADIKHQHGLEQDTTA